MSHAVARLLNFKSGEMPLALRSAAFYFTVLCGYFFLRPVREAMGVSRGMGDLRWLFITTSAVSLVIVLVFGGVVSRTDRRRFIPVGYGFVVVCLLVFAGLLTVDAFAGGGLIGSDADTPGVTVFHAGTALKDQKLVSAGGRVLGVTALHTLSGHRGRGLGGQVLAALLGWGRDLGAGTAYLQVDAANRAAGAWYRRLGFGLHHQYGYVRL